jgi:hypothetical protein
MKSLLSFALVSLFSTGCAMENVTTEIRVRDPHAVLTRTDATGSRPVPLPSDSAITLNASSAMTVTPEVLASPAFDLKWSTPLGRDPRGENRKYDVVQGWTEGTVGYRLQTDWADVRIVEHRRPDHAGAWAIIGLSTVAFGALSAIVFTAPDIKGGPGVRMGLGVGTAAVGAAYDVAMIPTLATSDADIVIHDFGQRIGTRPIVID